MKNKEVIESICAQGRTIGEAVSGDDALGPLKHLPGTWKNLPNLQGRGWNMIAVPYAEGEFGYRLLLNQYNETLKFSTVDKGVPNRGIPSDTYCSDGDQFLAVLDYEQSITQIAADDSPQSGKAGASDLPIHHEPGLWLHMLNKTTSGLDIARLGTIPHGDSVLALGKYETIPNTPEIPNISGLPIGVNQSLDNPYLAPYKQFNDQPFQGVFNPLEPNHLLEVANQGVEVVETTVLHVDSTIESGGIKNIPFIVKQANATEMNSTFWIQELKERDASGNRKLRLQYTQTIFIDFFPRKDGVPGLIRWPHVSINTLEKVVE